MKNPSILRAVALAAATLALASGASAQQMTTLKFIWEVKPTANDFMTTQSTYERDLFSSTNRGAIAYVPYAGIAGTVPLYRLVKNTDHMDSKVPNEGGYTNEGVTGYIWTSGAAVRGLGELKRLVNPSTNDHALVKAGDSIAGYTVVESPGAFGYPRYNKDAESLLAVSAGGVTVQSNKVAGGSIWSWNWGGFEFVNHLDYGREIQAAIDWRDSTGALHNPTEGGSSYSRFPDPGNNQGSPLYQATTAGNVHTTLAVPLEWNPQNFGGGPTNPVVYQDMLLGKEVTLDYRQFGPVAKYVTKMTLGSPLSLANLQAPAAFLSAQLNHYYTYDAISNQLQEIFPPTTDPSCLTGTNFTPPSGRGAIIVSDETRNFAMAIAGTTTAAGGKLQSFIAYDCRAAGNTSILSAYTGHKAQPAGDSAVTTFVVTEKLNNIPALLQKLRIAGDI